MVRTLTSLVFICTLEKGGISIDQVCIRRSSASPLRFFANPPHGVYSVTVLWHSSSDLCTTIPAIFLILGHIRGRRWDTRIASLREGIHISEGT